MLRLLSLATVFAALPLAAQPSTPGPVTAVPLDGGLGLLALAGAGYAARRLRAGR